MLKVQYNSTADRKSMFDGGPTVARGTNCGSRTWSGGTIGGAVFGPAGPLAARTTCGVTDHVSPYGDIIIRCMLHLTVHYYCGRAVSTNQLH